jgi:hypothetical protein
MNTIANGESGDKRQEIPTPNSHKEALGGDDAENWLPSMVQEYEGLKATGTFEEVDRPQGRNVVGSRWQYRVKRRADGTPHFKSRLVAKGYSQKQGVDYTATFAPTPRLTTARVLLHLAAALCLLVHVMDVDQAFLHGDLEEEIYMEPPPGLGTVDTSKVWRLRRPLYGLKQSPRQWHSKLKGVLLELGFQPVHGDPSLFLYKGEGSLWILVYVDDLLLLSNSTAQLDRFKAAILKHFPMKDLGEVSTYLGIQVTRDLGKQEIYLSQEKFVHEIVRKFGQEGAKEAATPLQVNHGLTLAQEGDLSVPEQDRYPELLGSMMYLMVCTRPDIAHALSVLSRFVAPGRHSGAHYKAALRLLGYLKGTAGHKLVLGGGKSTLVGHSDSSWADDQQDRKSSQGHCFSLGAGVVSWKAGRSPSVALSTCEAELYAATSAAQESLWLMDLLALLGHPQLSPSPTLWCDNQSTVILTRDPVFSGRSKHIEARYFFIKELVQRGRLHTAHIPGTLNVADIFTKPLAVDDHTRLVDLLGLRPAGQ